MSGQEVQRGRFGSNLWRQVCNLPRKLGQVENLPPHHQVLSISVPDFRLKQTIQQHRIDAASKPDLSVDRHNGNLIAELLHEFFLSVNIYDFKLEMVAFLFFLKKPPSVIAQVTPLASVEDEMKII